MSQISSISTSSPKNLARTAVPTNSCSSTTLFNIPRPNNLSVNEKYDCEYEYIDNKGVHRTDGYYSNIEILTFKKKENVFSYVCSLQISRYCNENGSFVIALKETPTGWHTSAEVASDEYKGNRAELLTQLESAKVERATYGTRYMDCLISPCFNPQKDATKIRKTLDFIHKYEPFSLQDIQIIEEKFGIYTNLIPNLEYKIESYESALTKAKIAQGKGDFELIWELANHLENTKRMREACGCYTNISENNPYYSQAGQRGLSLTSQAIACDENASTGLDEEDASMGRAEAMFTFAFNNLPTHPENQELINSLFYQLLGKGIGRLPFDIKPDATSFVALAAAIRNGEFLSQQSSPHIASINSASPSSQKFTHRA